MKIEFRVHDDANTMACLIRSYFPQYDLEFASATLDHLLDQNVKILLDCENPKLILKSICQDIVRDLTLIKNQLD